MIRAGIALIFIDKVSTGSGLCEVLRGDIIVDDIRTPTR